MAYYERRLPHLDAIGRPLFVTFRPHGSLPSNRIFPSERMTSGQAFVAMDRLLDQATAGPLSLRRPDIAGLVIQTLYDGQDRLHRYQIAAFVVMPNHVQLLVSPEVTMRQWLGPLKGFTAYQANRVLGRHAPFWQGESYDHLVRDDKEFERIRHYIEHNPVKAGLAASPEQFPGSSAAPGRSPAAGLKA